MPSVKYALAGSPLRFSKGKTATPFVTGAGINSLFQTIHPRVAVKATNDAINAAIAGFLRTHLRACVKNPLGFAWIDSCFSQCSRSSASARADGYRRFGSFSRHFRQIVERSRSILRFNARGFRGSVFSSSRIVSYVVPPANGG